MTLWSRLCLCALLAAGAAARADATFTNHSSSLIFLQLHTVKLNSAVLRIQVHVTGGTPKIETQAIILEGPGSETKVCLNDDQLQAPYAKGFVLTNATRLDQVQPIRLFPGNAITFTVLTPGKAEDRSNHVAFGIRTRSPRIDGPDFLDQHLDVQFRTAQDPRKGSTEKLVGVFIKALESKDAPYAHQFDFKPRESKDGLLRLVDVKPKEGGSCVTM